MDFSLTADQHELREVARRYLADHYPPERITQVASAGSDIAAWHTLAGLGWFEAGMVERALLAEECGYALLPTPWWSALALPEPPDGPIAMAHGGFSAKARSHGGWLVTGTAAGVPDALTATAFLVSAEGRTFQIAPSACTVTAVAGVDPLRAGADLSCTDVPAWERPLMDDSFALRSQAVLAAEAVGVARRACDFAVAYARVRSQFGRPAAGFADDLSEVAAGMADCHVLIEIARSLAYKAAWLLDEHDSDLARIAVAMATPAARHAAVTTCEKALRVLEPPASDEHPVHHWYRRALWLREYGPSDADCLEEIAGTLF
ncbi:acyl-CoA dehydrogenase family protein [Hamadaea tsunoensis]|uniref:acyl-CoA dehydrogenase family protein n=1 Tax=Hamadaea tsunoensis TaxID=53368 RepID=UPI00040E8487|nr:acyl-CoA dehydrogenase family protein [Hamadaea tsunoensis]